MSMDKDDMKWFVGQFDTIRDGMEEKHTDVIERLVRVETRVNGTVDDVTELKKEQKGIVKTIIGLAVASAGGGSIGAAITKLF